MLDKGGINERKFKYEFGYKPTQLTGSEIQGYILNGAKGISGLKSRFPTLRGQGSPAQDSGIPKEKEISGQVNHDNIQQKEEKHAKRGSQEKRSRDTRSSKEMAISETKRQSIERIIDAAENPDLDFGK